MEPYFSPYRGKALEMIAVDPSANRNFLILNMTIENHGYDRFNLNSSNFVVIADNVEYAIDDQTSKYMEDRRWSPLFNVPLLSSVKLLNGGQTSGVLIFQIPKEETKYSIAYSNPEGYNLRYNE